MTNPSNNNLDPHKSRSFNGSGSSISTSEVNGPSIEEASHLNHQRNKLIWVFTSVLAAIGLAWVLLWIFYLQYYESTDDAYANGSMVSLNSPIQGTVIAFYADDTDLVEEGQLIVELDSTYYRMAYEKALASLASQALQIKEYSDNVKVSQANVDVRKAYFSKDSFDYENRSQLVSSRAVSNEDFIHSRDNLTISENELKKAEYQLKIAQDALGNGPLDVHPLLEEKKSIVREAYYHLKHCKIYAPTKGYVAKRSVNVGQSVTSMTNLLWIIPANDVWVDANYKETQLRYMRVGQPATACFDLYGSKVKFKGKVLGIASGSGSVFSLIPPQNATGNWIKIVQRLSVRISLDPKAVEKYPIRLGISAEVFVDITQQDLPMLTQIPPKKAVATTRVYDLDLEEVNKIIDEIVRTSLEV
jgi:membrane fusion protein, multidrug efflux system